MATMGMSYCAITACLLLCFTSQSIDAVNYHFDDSSCDNLLPVVDAVTPGRQNVPNRESSPQNGQKSLLVASNETAPYSILAPTYYKPGKLYNVTLYGGEFNGFILQARLFRSASPQYEVWGTFVDTPAGVNVLECGTDSDPNTAVSTNTSPKKSVTVTWKYPLHAEGNIEFVATVVKNNTYWPNVKKAPDTFAEPDLKNCGKLTSCYRYSGTSGACTDKECDFVFVSKIEFDHVAFTVGGKFTETKGYIGVAFTNEKFGKLELFACVKHLNDLFEVKHYIAQDIESQPEEKFQQLDTTQISYGDSGRHVWCRFRRALQLPGSQLSDFTQNQTMMFLRGPLMHTSRGIVLPQLGKSFVFAENQWNHTEPLVNNLVTVDGGSRGEPLMCLTVVSIAVTLFFASGN